MENKNDRYAGIWLPKEIIKNNDLTLAEKVMLAVFASLTKNQHKESFASNKYLANILNVTPRRVQQILSNLKAKGYVHSRNIFREEGEKFFVGGMKTSSLRGVKMSSFTPRNVLHPDNIIDNKVKDIKVNKEFRKIFNDFINYRNEIHKPLSETSQEKAVKRLLKLSDNNLDVARKIVEQTIANGWLSLQPLSGKNKHQKLQEGRILQTDDIQKYNDLNF